MALHVKGVEIQVKNWLDEIMKVLSTIKLMGKTGPIEDSIINLTLKKEGSRKLDNLEVLAHHPNEEPLGIPRKESNNRRTAQPTDSQLTSVHC